MALSPIALSSCTISVRNPDTTLPKGRIQTDLRTYPYGGLDAFCEPDQCILGPDGEPLRGLGIRLHNVDQRAPSPTPPAGYVNALGVTADNTLFVDLARDYEPSTKTTAVNTSFIQGGGGNSTTDLGPPISHCVSNPSGARARVRRQVTVINASVENPPGDGASGTVNVNTAGQTSTVALADIYAGAPGRADVTYQLDIDGAKYWIVRACTGQCAANSVTIELDPVFVAPGANYTMTIQPELAVTAAASDRFPIAGGTVTTTLTLVAPPPSSDFLYTPGCS